MHLGRSNIPLLTVVRTEEDRRYCQRSFTNAQGQRVFGLPAGYLSHMRERNGETGLVSVPTQPSSKATLTSSVGCSSEVVLTFGANVTAVDMPVCQPLALASVATATIR